MRKSAALLGQGEGPKVRVAKARAKASVRGLRPGEQASLETFCVEGRSQEVVHVSEDGVHPLNECHFVVAKYEGSNRGFICCILLGA